MQGLPQPAKRATWVADTERYVKRGQAENRPYAPTFFAER
jgi:hypothetical protein